MFSKKSFGLIFVSLLFLSLVAGVVSAQIGPPAPSSSSSFADAITRFINGLQEVGDPIFRPLLGVSDDGSELFVRILAFFLVALIIYGIMDSIRLVRNKWINFSIGLIVSLIGVRFMPPGLLTSLTEPASALVALVFMGIPFIVAFFMIEKVGSAPARRALWTAYGVLMLVLFIYKWGDRGFEGSFAWVDLLIILGIIIAFWFDGTFQRFKSKARANRISGSMDADMMDRIELKLEEKKSALTSGGHTEQEKERLRREIKGLEKQLREFAGLAAGKGA